MKKPYFLLPVICLFTFTAHAQIKEAEVKRILSALSADDMQGRMIFTPGIEKAAVFLEDEFQKAGLQPLDGAASYRQTFARYNIRSQKQQLTISGKEEDGQRVMMMGVETHLEWNEKTSVVVKQLRDTDNFDAKLGELRGASRNTLVWVDGIHREKFETYYKSLHEGNSKRSRDSSAAVVLVLKEGQEPTPEVWSVKIDQEVVRMPLSNIAGMIKGSSKPDEYVIFSGHYDHIGILPPVAGDSIANGADDDASGVTAVLMLAKYFKQHPPARTLLFVAFTAEESGGYGSRYFSQQLDPEKIVAMFNIEMIGKESKFGQNSAFITGFERSDFGTILQKNLEKSVFRFHPDPYPEQQLFYRSDNATLARLGVPAHTISTTQIDKDERYHSVDDEMDSMDVKNIASIIQAIATSAASIVNGVDTPTRIDKTAVGRN
ncbi:MAG TPA: M20/M25/M40 family metallo-hydrolase [Chitinophaga sp.]|nr:M20/M25/M40 family metallo-hydrolase [Chitinophaga sp.]